MRLSIVFTIILLSLFLSACSSPSEPRPRQPPPAAQEERTSYVGIKSRAACRQAGGRWRSSGVFGIGIYGCILPTPDAGKACTDYSQCQYDCLARDGEKPRPGEPATGQCQADNTYTDCFIEIRGGRAMPEFCMSF